MFYFDLFIYFSNYPTAVSFSSMNCPFILINDKDYKPKLSRPGNLPYFHGLQQFCLCIDTLQEAHPPEIKPTNCVIETSHANNVL